MGQTSSVRSLFIGINGGHLRSSAVAIDATAAQVIGKVHRLPLNPHSATTEILLHRAEELLSVLADDAGFESVRDLAAATRQCVFALPGAGLWHEQRDMAMRLTTAIGHDRLSVVDDTWAGLFAETLSPRGVCAFAGTGASVCIAPGTFLPTKEYKIDGWGPVIGDFGSGFQIVTRFFRQLGRQLDTGAFSGLFEQLQAESEQLKLYPALNSIEQVQNWFDRFVAYHHTEWRSHFSRLAEPLCKTADKAHRDKDLSPEAVEANALVQSVASEMITSLTIAAKRLPAHDRADMPLVLQGGILRNCDSYQSVVRDGLSSLFGNVAVARLRPVDGAALMACSLDIPADELPTLQGALLNRALADNKHEGAK